MQDPGKVYACSTGSPENFMKPYALSRFNFVPWSNGGYEYLSSPSGLSDDTFPFCQTTAILAACSSPLYAMASYFEADPTIPFLPEMIIDPPSSGKPPTFAAKLRPSSGKPEPNTCVPSFNEELVTSTTTSVHNKAKRSRTSFTGNQLAVLEAEFKKQEYIGGLHRSSLATLLGLTEAQVKVWWQNRRIKQRRLRLQAPPLFSRLENFPYRD